MRRKPSCPSAVSEGQRRGATTSSGPTGGAQVVGTDGWLVSTEARLQAREDFKGAWSSGHDASMPRWKRGFDSLRALHFMIEWLSGRAPP